MATGTNSARAVNRDSSIVQGHGDSTLPLLLPGSCSCFICRVDDAGEQCGGNPKARLCRQGSQAQGRSMLVEAGLGCHGWGGFSEGFT